MPQSDNPYEHLFIYHLEGHPPISLWQDYPQFFGCWIEDNYAFLFFAHDALELVKKELDSLSGVHLIDHYEMSYADWQAGEEIRPIEVGRLTLYPFWQKIDKKTDRIHLPLDPGVVFGTGAHPTTKDCLKALHHIFSTDSPREVLDIGTGTGILALASAALGAGHVLAVDLNPLCVRTTQNNIERNGYSSIITVENGDALSYVSTRADLAIANIHMAIMEKLVCNTAFLSRKWLVLSGLMRTQARIIESILTNRPVEIVKKWESEGIWTTFLVKGSA